jgi:hypothetical protein
MLNTLLDPSRPELFLPSFVVLWCAGCGLIALGSGWVQLARVYRSTGAFSGTQWGFQSAGFRYLARYSRVLTIGYGSGGLYMAVFPLFRVMHPPLLIPWKDLVKRRGLFGWTAVLTSAQCPSVPISISWRLLEKLEAAAQSALPGSV